MREGTRAQIAKNCPSARVQHTQASPMPNEETKVMWSAAKMLAMNLQQT
jgi:hypothetical protein